MEQPPGSVDDVQPEDLATSSIPTVIDLTRRNDRNASTLDGLQVVKSSNPALPPSETSPPDVTLQSGDQIQPDNAFSRTTVTLSYVSRSHVCATQDSSSCHSPMHTAPPISRFSLHPPCEADKGLGEAGCELNQHHAEEGDGPVDPDAHAPVLQSASQAQAALEDNGTRLMQQQCQVNGGVCSDGEVHKALLGEEERGLSEEMANSRGPENGDIDGRLSSGVGMESSSDALALATGKLDSVGGSDGLLHTPKKVVQDSMNAKELCSLTKEYRSPLEDPVSPSATSLDDVQDVFLLPQASSSPSGDNSLLDAADEAARDDASSKGGRQLKSATSDTTASLGKKKQPARKRRETLVPSTESTDHLQDVSEEKSQTVIPHVNGNARTMQKNVKEKKLPMRSGRGTRLEAIVMNINSSRYKVSGCIRANKNSKATRMAVKDSKKNKTLSEKKERTGKACVSSKTVKQRVVSPTKADHVNSINTDSCKDATSKPEPKSASSTPEESPQFAGHKRSKKDPEDAPHSTRSKRKTSPASSPPATEHKKSKQQPEPHPHPKPSKETLVVRSPPPASTKSPKKSPASAKGKAAAGQTSPAARTPKRRRKKRKPCQSSSMFSPKEPEIKLRYVNYKEEKRDTRLDNFSPYVHVERRLTSPSLSTVVNYPEEVRVQHKKGQQQQQHSGGFISATVPSTSCLQLGRASTQSQHQRPLVCCLCGLAANAMDLGDLHGPYFPEGQQPSRAAAGAPGLKEEKGGSSDSDSSSCTTRNKRRKCAVPPKPWTPRPAKQKGSPRGHPWTPDNTGSPAAKRARPDGTSADVEDWYSPPVLPMEPREHWLHQDCGIWSAGVFLVKGKVFGLEEAVKVARETMCSACSSPGAMLGCFFKGCPNKYHYRCALQSDCVLTEENFSMKCKKHKNKTFKACVGKQREDR